MEEHYNPGGKDKDFQSYSRASSFLLVWVVDNKCKAELKSPSSWDEVLKEVP